VWGRNPPARCSDARQVPAPGTWLELDVREIHVEEKVNALETMKLLATGSAHEQRLRAGCRGQAG
jgi:hypothetical protein